MATTQDQRDDFRYDLDVSETQVPDSEIDRLFVRAGLRYSENSNAVEAYARILAIDALLTSAARLVDYTQANSSEKLSQMTSALRKKRDDYRDDLVWALNDAEDGIVSKGGIRRKPTHLQEYPDDYPPDWYGYPYDVSRPTS